MDTVNKVLEERGQTYGSWETQSRIAQVMKKGARSRDLGIPPLLPEEEESMDMIINKLSRIVNGTLHSDNWRDIAGYATLAMVAVEKAEAANAVEKARASAAAAERAKTAIKQAVEAPPAAPDTPVPVPDPENWPASQPIDDNEPIPPFLNRNKKVADGNTKSMDEYRDEMFGVEAKGTK